MFYFLFAKEMFCNNNFFSVYGKSSIGILSREANLIKAKRKTNMFGSQNTENVF